jgi:DNA-binding response OmpR family regulator
VSGLESSADDDVAKPFHREELYARFQFVLRVTEGKCALRPCWSVLISV